MKLVLENFFNIDPVELKDNLLTQDGIIDVQIDKSKPSIVLNIDYNEKTTPLSIMNYIESLHDNNYSALFAFDKGTVGKFKTKKYIVDDMCCEYCYRNLVMDLFENKKIKSVKSNFNYNVPAFNIEFIIEYDEEYSEEELLNYIKEKYN